MVKIGGATLKDEPQIAAIAGDLVALRTRGDHVVLVHGGGPQVTELLERLGTPNPSRAGRRITDAPMLEVVKMVLGGQLNINLALTLRAAGLPIMALSGVSAGIIDGIKRPPRVISGWGPDPVDFGHVGDIVGINTEPLRLLCEGGYVPLLNSIGADRVGNAYNINADIAATRIFQALEADHLVLVAGEVRGVMRDFHDPTSRIPSLTVSEARAAIADGVIKGGMIPKIEESLSVLDQSVGAIHICGALRAGELILAIEDEGAVGTVLRADA
ncbi:MAG: acetylglutamate kinase [Myxococcota bacterium]|nr:acetylglutamate kinase [Myxococcota bacterium]